MLILVVEDDSSVAELVQSALENEGHQVDVTEEGVKAEVKAQTGDYDVLVVDWILPDLDGRTLIERLRERGDDTLALMLTVRSEVDDRVRAFRSGADDYMTKPFAVEELIARLEALGRRGARDASPTTIEAGLVEVDPKERRVYVADEPVRLRPKEFKLLATLARRVGSLVTRGRLAERVWRDDYVSDDVINVTVSGLRRKLREATSELDRDVQIETVRGAGYRLEVG